MPNKEQLRRLCKGVFAFYNYENQIVDVYKLLWATTSREHKNIKGRCLSGWIDESDALV